MRLLEEGRAPNPRRVRIFLAEKGISIPTEQVDITLNEHKTSDFALRNPMRQVPVLLLDDGTAISESVAICRYFEELKPDPVLFGSGARERAIVEMMNRRVEFGLLSRVAHAFRHTHPAMAELEKPQIKEWGELNRSRIAEMLELLDRDLGGSRFMAGDTFSIADITALVAIDFMRPIRFRVPEELSNLRRWHADVSARPSAKA